MTPLIDLTLRSSAIVLVGLIASGLLRHRSAALRHFVLTVSLFAAAAVVPFSAVAPAWTVNLPVATDRSTSSPSATLEVVSVTATGRGPRPVDVSAASLLAAVWLAGVCIGGAMLLAGLARLAWISRRATHVETGEWKRAAEDLAAKHGLRRAVTVLQTDSPDLLATYGVFRPRVLLPAGAGARPSERVYGVLCHELAHIRRCDWCVQICADILRTICWFNPLMWLACARLRIESEQACDDAVLGEGVAPREYATQLLHLARMCRASAAWISATPMARPSRLERRITAMLNPAVDRASLSRRAVILTIALLGCLTLPIASLRAGQGTSAALEGSVYDPTGAVMPGVSLTLTNAQDVKTTAITDRAGRFEFAAIPPGEYVLEASLAGFRPLRQQLQLRNSGDWDRAITLQVGELSETITVRASRVAVSETPTPGTQLRVGGNIRVPRKLVDVKPVYPESMRAAGREGVVPMEAIIGRDGTVTSVRVLSADVHPDFAISAADAVRQWQFAPTLLNGQTIEVRMQVSITYTLSQ